MKQMKNAERHVFQTFFKHSNPKTREPAPARTPFCSSSCTRHPLRLLLCQAGSPRCADRNHGWARQPTDTVPDSGTCRRAHSTNSAACCAARDGQGCHFAVRGRSTGPATAIPAIGNPLPRRCLAISGGRAAWSSATSIPATSLSRQRRTSTRAGARWRRW
jgi:hypothetical protein